MCNISELFVFQGTAFPQSVVHRFRCDYRIRDKPGRPRGYIQSKFYNQPNGSIIQLKGSSPLFRIVWKNFKEQSYFGYRCDEDGAFTVGPFDFAIIPFERLADLTQRKPMLV